MKYLIVGNGALAQNISFYFSSLKIDVLSWFKNCGNELSEVTKKADVVLLAISTSSLKNIFEQYPCLKSKKCFHFSGSYYSEEIFGMHPLMSFPKDEILDLKTLQSMSFGIDFKKNEFHKNFPGLKNPLIEISPEDKIYYHFLCVMSGNFSKYLWEFVKGQFQEKFGDSDHLREYLKRTTTEILDSKSNFTGPLERMESELVQDYEIILKNNKNLQNILKAFKDFRREEFDEIR